MPDASNEKMRALLMGGAAPSTPAPRTASPPRVDPPAAGPAGAADGGERSIDLSDPIAAPAAGPSREAEPPQVSASPSLEAKLRLVHAAQAMSQDPEVAAALAQRAAESDRRQAFAAQGVPSVESPARAPEGEGLAHRFLRQRLRESFPKTAQAKGITAAVPGAVAAGIPTLAATKNPTAAAIMAGLGAVGGGMIGHGTADDDPSAARTVQEEAGARGRFKPATAPTDAGDRRAILKRVAAKTAELDAQSDALMGAKMALQEGSFASLSPEQQALVVESLRRNSASMDEADVTDSLERDVAMLQDQKAQMERTAQTLAAE